MNDLRNIQDFGLEHRNFYLITTVVIHWMTTVIGVTCLYSMIYLPAYLHLCGSAEALGSGVACYRLSRT